MVGLLDTAFTINHVPGYGAAGVKGVQTSEPVERLQDRGEGRHLETAVIDGDIDINVQGLQCGQLCKLEAVVIVELEQRSP